MNDFKTNATIVIGTAVSAGTHAAAIVSETGSAVYDATTTLAKNVGHTLYEHTITGRLLGNLHTEFWNWTDKKLKERGIYHSPLNRKY